MVPNPAILLDNPKVALQTTTPWTWPPCSQIQRETQPSSMTTWKSLTKFIPAGMMYWTSSWQHQTGTPIEMAAASWRMASEKLDLVLLTAFKVTMDCHLFQKSLRRLERHLGDLDLWKDWENESNNKEDPGKNMPGNALEVRPGTPYCLALH